VAGKKWIQGRCQVCNKTQGFLQRATYEGAPEGGVVVHQDCLDKFYQQLMDEQWNEDMAAAAAAAAAATLK
jgi:hypothetical protein